MDDLNYVLSELGIFVDNCDFNEQYIKFTFGYRQMFIKFLLHVTNCKMSDELSKNIHTVWTIELIMHNGNIKNVMNVINNFSERELDKIIENENKEYSVIFPFSMLQNVIDQLINECDIECDSCFMVCTDPNHDLSDDLIYSDDDL